MTDVHAPDPFARAEASAATLKRLTGVPDFDAAVVLGSGWLAAADAIGAAELEVPLADLGGFERPTTEGHSPAVRYIKDGNHRILLFLGRVPYEVLSTGLAAPLAFRVLARLERLVSQDPRGAVAAR